MCPILIGRESSVAVLDDALRNVCNGSGGTILIAGEAGVGKSRLVSELQTRAATAGVDLFRGNCYESDRAIPYAPIAELFREGSGRDRERSLLNDAGAQAARLIPVFPELAGGVSDPPSVAPLDPAGEQRRVFEALVTVLDRVSARRPVVVVVEDLHWIDEGSLSFLLFAVRRLSRQAVLFVFTYRPDDASIELRHALAEIDRARLGIELRLGPLRANDVALMVQSIVGLQRPVRADVLARLFELTDGNPFFVEEVLKAQNANGSLLDADLLRHQTALDDDPVPPTVIDAVQRRLQPLTGAARQVLSLAAVAGREFDFEVLRIALTCEDDALIDAMRELIAAQLVVEESADRFAFRHALTRQAVSASLLARERRMLHQTLLTALETLAAAGQEPPPADLASHAFAAGSWARAIDYARRAGDVAVGMHAPYAAIDHYTRALEAAKRGQISAPFEVLRDRGLAYRTVGNFDAALADHLATLHQARARGDRRGEWQALLELGFHWSERDYTEAHARFSAALSLAREAGDPAMLAASLNRLGNWHMNREEPAEALVLHREALALFEAERDRPGIADTLGLLAMTTGVAGELAESFAWFARAIMVSQDLGDRAGTAFGLAGSALCCPLTDMDTFVPSTVALAQGIERCEEATRIAREIGWRSGEVFAGMVLTHCLIAGGAYGRALAVGRAAHELADDIAHHQWIVAIRHTVGRLFLDLFAFAQAREYLEPALTLARTIDSPFFVRNVSGFLALVAIAEGALDEADALLDRDLPLDSPMVGPGRRVCWCARAELALARHQPGEALRIADRLLQTAGGEERNQPIPRLWKLRADVMLRLGRIEEAHGALDIARAAADGQGLLPQLWRIDRARAVAYRARHRYVQADEATAQARSTIDRLAVEIPDDLLRSTFLAGATARLSPPSPRRLDRIAHDGLTARETEIAVLIARGFTNRLIAESLVLSELTVETHVKHILSKLGVGSRAQVAAWAARKELFSPE